MNMCNAEGLELMMVWRGVLNRQLDYPGLQLEKVFQINAIFVKKLCKCWNDIKGSLKDFQNYFEDLWHSRGQMTIRNSVRWRYME